MTGLGAISPLGRTWPETFRALATGGTAISPIDVFDASSFPCGVAAPIREVPLGSGDRRLHFARAAAREAWDMAAPSARPARTGVFIGAESGRAGFDSILRLSRAAGGGVTFDHGRFGNQARALAAHMDAAAVSPAAVASALAGEFGAEGPVVTISVACASGAAAVVEGARAIRRGACDVALCGGVGADVDPLMLAGFGLLGALSERGLCCPFDARRDGFVVGEGAAMVVLQATPGDLGVCLTGAARSLDAHHLTKPDPDAVGAIAAMRAALDQAGRHAVDYIQAHGTSTPLNDAVEARAIRAVFPERWPEIDVSSVKGSVGHWVAGAGAVGLLCAIEAILSGILPPTAGLREAGPGCELRHVIGQAIERRVTAALVNAFAFGGANASLVVEAHP